MVSEPIEQSILQAGSSRADGPDVDGSTTPEPDGSVTDAIDRRRFLSWGVGVGVTAGAVGLAIAALGRPELAAAAGSPPVITPDGQLWRLNPSWGFPMSNTGRCECNCRACVSHGTNKVFFSRAAAETGRAHVGCVCIAEPYHSTVDLEALRRLSTDGSSVDRRRPAVDALFGGPSDGRVDALT